MPQTRTFRLAVGEVIHRRIKLLSIRRRANRLPLSSISEIVGEALSQWLEESRPIVRVPAEDIKGIQTTFKLKDERTTQLYTEAIVQRLETDPMRRSGARLDREETDGILDAWLNENSEDLEPLRVPD